MIVELTEGDLRSVFDRETLRRGAAIYAEEDIQHFSVSGDGSRVGSSVLGSRPQPYTQDITLTLMTNGRVRIKGSCTCPMGQSCKHVAAVLMMYLDLLEGDDMLDEVLEIAPPAHAAARASAAQLPLFEEPRPASALSPLTSQWLERLASAGSASGRREEPAASANQRVLLYVLNHQNAPAHGKAPVSIRPVSVRLRKDGSIAEEKSYNPENIQRPAEQRARFLTEADVETLRGFAWLVRTRPIHPAEDIALGSDAASRGIFERVLRSGRLRLGRVDGMPLASGPSVRAEPRWMTLANGAQKLTLLPVAQGSEGTAPGAADGVPFAAVLPLDPPHYVDPVSGLVGPIETSLPPELAVEVARAPAIAPSEAAIVREAMRQKLAPPPGSASEASAPAARRAPALPLPEAPDNVEIREIKPVPRLELTVATVRVEPMFGYYARQAGREGIFPLPVARLAFDYGGDIVASGGGGAAIERMENGRLILTLRDAKAEAAAANRLAKLGFKLLSTLPFKAAPEHANDLFLTAPRTQNPYEIVQSCGDPDRFLAFSSETVPQLIKQGWQVRFADGYPYHVVQGAAEWWADIGESAGVDWLSFEMGVEFEGHRINLVQQLAALLERLPANILALAHRRDQHDKLLRALNQVHLYHPLPDGRLLPLPGNRLGSILTALLELIGPRKAGVDGGRMKLHRAEIAALAAFAGEAGEVAWAASAQRLIELGKRLRSRRAPGVVEPPAAFQAQLRPYQREGLAWLDFLRDAGFGGVLADDMGLGKTVQALAFLAREKAEGRLDRPALIVSPTSVLPNWQAEAERFAPQLSVLALRGAERKALFAGMASHDIVLTTYPLLARDHEMLLPHAFHAAILDEAQAIKNPKAAISAIAHRIDARHRFALTGTPLENNLGEVWSLFQFLSPGLLGDEGTFRRTFRTPIEKHGDAAAQAFLSNRLKPFLLRRTKQEVASELPPKTEIAERIRLEGAQRDLYETVRSLMHARVRDEIARKGLAKSHIVFLDALLKLRQICCDPRLLKMPEARKVKGSAKLERLMEMVPELVGEGRRILLFSQFTSMLALIEAELAAAEIPYVQLTGDTVDRAAPVRAFQAGKAPVFLLSLKAGGTGLNLTAADTVIHYDPWWNPAVEAQATDRAYRIGQDKPVFVHKLIVEEGIEAAIEQLKARKAALADALFAGSAKTPLDLTEADISALFAPLGGRAERRAA